MRYMIHAYPGRMWYVNEFLIPSMKEQGIKDEEIKVWEDKAGKGNLFACMDSFIFCGENTNDGTWHIQDDVIIARDFAVKTRQYNSGVVCGFVHPKWGPNANYFGSRGSTDLWYSFQCIRIPDKMAGECGVWFYTTAMKSKKQEYRSRIERKKHDDDFFRYFLLAKYPNTQVMNLKPNLVDHIDYLIGGTLINANRNEKINRAAYFEDDDLVDELEQKLKKRSNLK